MNRGTTVVDSLPKTVTRWRRGCAEVQHANHSAAEPPLYHDWTQLNCLSIFAADISFHGGLLQRGASITIQYLCSLNQTFTIVNASRRVVKYSMLIES